jgi:hypothetical protein
LTSGGASGIKKPMMRPRAALLAGLIGLALIDGHPARLAADANPEPRNVIGAELTAIHQCVREVRQAVPGSDFDARVSTQGPIRYDGTDAEIAAFKRCMQLKGFSVE